MTQVCEELTPGLTSVVLCESGVGHRQFRIPGFTVSTRGTLVVAVDARPDLDRSWTAGLQSPYHSSDIRRPMFVRWQ